MTINRFREEICTSCDQCKECRCDNVEIKSCPKFIESKIRTYTDGRTKVIAVGSYKGKYIRAISKCHPNDKFDLKFGKRIAITRCNHMIAWERLRDARRRLEEANRETRMAHDNLDFAEEFFNDAVDLFQRATKESDKIYILTKK